MLSVGFSHTQQGSTSLPLDLAPLGAGPGCKQWFSLDLTWAVATSLQGAATWSLSLPNVPALVETTLFAGFYVLDPQAPSNQLGIVPSQPIALVIGL